MNLSFIKSHEKQTSTLFLIISSLLFLFIKFLVIYGMNKGRTFPVEVDDSTRYISTIDKIAHYGVKVHNSESYKSILHYINKYQDGKDQKCLSEQSDYVYFSWSSLLAIVHKATAISPVRLYGLSFYFGIFLALVILIYFGARVENFNFVGSLLTTMMFFHGDGTYHGFFWVVPSFYILIFSILLIPVIFKSKHFLMNLLIILPFYIFLHNMSLLLFLIIGLMFIFYTLLNRRIDKDLLRRVMTFYLIGLTIVVSYLILNRLEILPKMLLVDSQSIKNIFLRPKVYTEVSDAGLYDRLSLFCRLVGLSSPGFVVLLIIGFTALVSEKHCLLLSLFLSAFCINLAMVFFTPRFLRFILFTRPIAFIVIAYGIYKVVSLPANRTVFLRLWTGYLALFSLLACLVAALLKQSQNGVYVGLFLIACLATNCFFNAKLAPNELRAFINRNHMPIILLVALIFVIGFVWPQLRKHKAWIKYARNRHPYSATVQEQEYFENQVVRKIAGISSCILYDHYNKLVVEYAMLKGLLDTPSAFINTLKSDDIQEIFNRYENIYYITFRDYVEPPRKPVEERLDKLKAQFSNSGLGELDLARIHKDYSLPIQIYKIERL